MHFADYLVCSQNMAKRNVVILCVLSLLLIFAFPTNFAIQLHLSMYNADLCDYYRWISVSVLNHKSMANNILLPKEYCK
jgi:hypothetical protein